MSETNARASAARRAGRAPKKAYQFLLGPIPTVEKNLKYVDMRRYEFVARAVAEIGRLVGGWLNAGSTPCPGT